MTQSLVPKTKLDLETANQAVSAGYPAVQEILGELIEWLQDYNWPVAKTLAPFLAEIGLPLVPHINHVLSTNDEMWKYWVIVCVISKNEKLFIHCKQRLIQYAENPSQSEMECEIDEVALETLVQMGI